MSEAGRLGTAEADRSIAAGPDYVMVQERRLRRSIVVTW